MVDVMHQAGHGFCAVLKHSADCKNVTDGDLFRKRAKEERQKIALTLPGVYDASS